MPNPLQKITKEKKAGNHKKQVREHIDAVYNMSEIVEAVRRYYNYSYPNSPIITSDRMRSLLLFFLDTIIHSVDRGARVTIPGFGSFCKCYIKEAYYPENIHNKITYRAGFNKVSFRMSKRFRDIVNKRRDDAFAENQFILDDLNDFDNPPEEKKERMVELKDKVLKRYPELKKEIKNIN